MADDSIAQAALLALSGDDIRRLHTFAAGLIRTRGLPESRYSHEDFVHKAFELFLDGKRHWNPDKVEILPFLMGIIKSIVGHQMEHDSSRWQELTEPDDVISRQEWLTIGSFSIGRKPEDILADQQVEDGWVAAARRCLNNDDESKGVFDLLIEEVPPKSICTKLEIDRRALNVIKLRIRRKLRNAGLGEFK